MNDSIYKEDCGVTSAGIWICSGRLQAGEYRFRFDPSSSGHGFNRATSQHHEVRL